MTASAYESSVVVIGASAGGVEALVTIAEGLPVGFPAPVFVVLHLPETGPSFLDGILDRAGPLPAVRARDGAAIAPGTITVAQRDRHLVLRTDGLRIVRGPKVNGHRPAVDVLFHSAAAAFGHCVIGVVLTGMLSDGTLGLREIKRRHGRAVVQADALHLGMPTSAIENVDVDAVVPLRKIARALTMMVSSDREAAVEDETGGVSELEAGLGVTYRHEAPGGPAPLRYPEYGGGSWSREPGESA